LERNAQRSTWSNLRKLLLEWAATAARGSPLHTEQYLQVLDGIPEGRGALRSAFVLKAKHFMDSPEGLNAMLPRLYSAMVGTSVRLRAAAAEALGELGEQGQQNLPELVFEAFTALLGDPYKMVHRTAVKTLRRLTLPMTLQATAKAALGQWINVYARQHAEDADAAFLIDSMRLYWHRFASDQERDTLRPLYIRILQQVKSHIVLGEIRWLRAELGDADGFPALIVKLLSEPRLSEHELEALLDTLDTLRPEMIRAHRQRLGEIAADEATSLFVTMRLVQMLTYAGAWTEAARATDGVQRRIPATTEHHPLKLQANLWRLATQFEEALSQEHLADVAGLASQWKATETQIEEDQAQHAEQRRFRPVFPASH
jgi:hypothetical protein